VDSISNNLAAITLVLAGLCLVAMLILLTTQVSQLRRRIDHLTGGVEGGDLEAILGEHLETVHQVGRDLDELTARMAFIESSARHHFSKVGLIRFNPFPDTGGNQSFALALLDESDDGVVISSLHSRTGTRIYGKSVSGGKADTSLSTEEQEAVEEARSKRPARPSTQPRSAAATRAALPAVQIPKAAVAPAPAARTLVAAAAPAARSAAAPAKAPRPEESNPEEENAVLPMSSRTKGQEKPKELLSPEDSAEVDSEKVHRKPGQR
jgi:Protein of unknown function (DUF4446)